MFKLTYSNGKVTSHYIKMYETGNKYISADGLQQIYKFDIGRIYHSAGKYYTYSRTGDELEFRAAIKASLTKRGLAHYHKWRELIEVADKI